MRKLFLILMTLCAVSWSLMAQNRTYSGSVVDAGNNEPLIGATVMPIGGGQGTATDVDGNFTLSVPANVKSVKVSYVGYKEQTVALHDKMIVHLASSSTNLDDVVVVAYGTANKESLTGSVAVVGSKEIDDRPVTSVTAALEGSAPGVSVNSSTGYPGSSPQIRIRGFNSFNSGALSPLYVVDGMVYTGAISDINPADVESMSVLKDAASCALYGSRGANGVVLITTKKAKGQGKVDVTFQMSLGAYGTAIPLYDRLDARQWMEASLMGTVNGLVTNSTVPTTYADQLAAYKGKLINEYCKGMNIWGYQDANGAWVPAEADQIFDENGKIAAGIGILPGYNDLNWWDAISQTGFRQEYNLNAAGASDKFDIFASMGYLQQDGYVICTDFERFTGRLNANFRPVNYFKGGINLSGSYTTGSTASVSASQLNLTNNPFQTQFYAPIRPIYLHDENGDIVKNEDGTPKYYDEGINNGGNLIWQTKADKKHNESVNLDGSIYGTAVLPYGFEATVRGGMYRSKTTFKNYSTNEVGSVKGMGALSEEFDDTWNYYFQQQINWSHEYGVHHVDVLLNHENNKFGSGYSYISLRDQKIDGVLALGNFSTESATALEGHDHYATESYLGRVRYNYDQKYFVEGSYNRDGSSQFAKNRRWGNFWSVGASWIITKEKFMHDVNWINYLKLRAAYGSVGNNQACSYYNYLTLYDWTSLGNIMPSQLAAPDLKWESTNTLDIALEGSLFNDRFTFNIGFFDKRNADLIFSVVQPGSGGTIYSGGELGYNPSILTNIGEMKNYGWELQFGVDIIRNSNLKWNFNADFSFITNKIGKLPDGKDLPGQGYFQGKSRFINYTYDWAGVDMLNGRSLYRINPSSPDFWEWNEEQGQYAFSQSLYDSKVNGAKEAGQYVEINGEEYSYDTAYVGRAIKGTKLPTVYGSFGTNLSWKGINFGLLFTYSIGGKIMNSNYVDLMGYNAQAPSALHKDVLNAWTSAPEGMTADSPNRINSDMIPQFNSQLTTENDRASSRYLIDASYLTLKNINLSYDLPRKWVNAMRLQNINVGFQMENAFIATAMKGLNPESAIGGVVGSSGAYYMPARTYTFQLSVKF